MCLLVFLLFLNRISPSNLPSYKLAGAYAKSHVWNGGITLDFWSHRQSLNIGFTRRYVFKVTVVK